LSFKGVEGTLDDSCTVSRVVEGPVTFLADGLRAPDPPSSKAVFVGEVLASSGVIGVLLVEMLAATSDESEVLEMGILVPFVSELRRLDVRGGGILARSGSPASRFWSAEGVC
jgi:hypothetical protein